MNSKKKSNLRVKIPFFGDKSKSDPPLIHQTPTIVIQCPSMEHIPVFEGNGTAKETKVEDKNEEIPFLDDDPGESAILPEKDKTEVKIDVDDKVKKVNGLTKEEEFENLDSGPGPLPESTFSTRPVGLRRNSISLPSGINELDLDFLRQQHMNHPANIPENHQSDSSSYSGGRREGSIEELNEILAEEKCAAIPLRNGRRKSVMPPKSIKPPRSPRSDDDSSTLDNSDDEDSPINSITSINSLASLLKEKLQSIPSKIKKKPTDYKIRAFVGFLFLCIVFFVGFGYVMYHQQVLARVYFLKIKFNKSNRIIKIFNDQNVEILKGNLGNYFGSAKAYDCIGNQNIPDGALCLQWLNGARLYINKEFSYADEPDVRCYSIHWESLNEGVNPTDCYDWSIPNSHWYGGGQIRNMTWPLEKHSHDFAPFITGDAKTHQWGNALMRHFINSKGSAIIIDNKTPLYVSIDGGNNKKFCLQARHDDFAYVNHITTYPSLKYNICIADIKRLHSDLSHQSLWDGLKQKDSNTINTLLSEPVWHISPNEKQNLTETMLYNYTEEVISLGFLKQGHVLINEHWQENIGDFTLDTSRFKTLEDTINVIHRRGFKIVFSIQPFVSTESINFAECVKKGLFISERHSNRKIPALTRYKTIASAGMLDITNNRTISWLHNKLQKVITAYSIDAFYLDFGTAYDMPHYYQSERPLINPDEYKTIFVERFEKLVNFMGVSSAVSLPKPPIFLSMPPFESTWEDLKKVIPTILSYGVVGYPFVMPGAVGGDIHEEYSLFNSVQGNYSHVLPDKELYLRWLQLATFLPVIKFTHIPNMYNDEVLNAVKNLTSLRQKTVTPLLIKYSEQALDKGLPLIRPLWMLEVNDPAGLVVDDEFSVGEELIVAPILEKNSVIREVYLPPGVWKDGIDGSLRKGSRWMHDYLVPLDKVAYFEKMPDNTRF